MEKGFVFVELFLPIPNGQVARALFQFAQDDFERNLYVRIADVNRNPDKSPMEEIKKIRSRKSGSERVFRTIGDYAWVSYYSSLIKPALEAFKSPTSLVEKKLISNINHNAASHGTKLGAFEPIDSNSFRLTEIGKLIKNSPSISRKFSKSKFSNITNQIEKLSYSLIERF